MVRATNWVGDAVMTMPALEGIKNHFPESSITVIAKPWVVPLFENHPYVDRVITFDKKRGGISGMAEIVRVAREIRKQRFHMAILFQNAFEAALIARLGGARLRVGYNTDGRGFLLTHSITPSEEVLRLHQVEYYLGILRAVGINAGSRNPRIFLAEKCYDRADKLLDAKGVKREAFLAGLGPGAVYGNAKRWPPERFAVIADWAKEIWGAEVLVLGSKNEMDICSTLCDSARYPVHNFCGTTSLEEVIGIIARCNIFLTNDSGLMHIAAALGIPTLAIFGSTDHIATGPRGDRALILKHDIDCAPCLMTDCPLDHRCMLSIEPEEVWEEMVRMKELFP